MDNINNLAFRKFSYGLFVLFTKDGEKQNGCIINTAVQLTAEKPYLISICVNNQNYSTEVIHKTGVFNLSTISEDANFDLFTRFGFSSGRDTDKLKDFHDVAVSGNGLCYLTSQSNSFLSAKVIDEKVCGSHTLFIAEVTEAEVLNEEPSATYAYYFAHIKPQPKSSEVKTEEKKIIGWRCIICGYEYMEPTLPDDYVCPLCKHPASDFEPIYG